MEIFHAAKERLGFDSNRFTTVLVVCLIALPLSVGLLRIYQNSSFDRIGEFAKVNLLKGKAQSHTASVDSKNYSLLLTSTSDGELRKGNLALAPAPAPSVSLRFGNDSGSRNNSSWPASTVNDKSINGTLAPVLGEVVGLRNDSDSPDNLPDEKRLNTTVSPRFSPPTSMLDEKMHNGTLSPSYSEGSGSRIGSPQSTNKGNDSLLGGLLSRRFDRTSCLSRYQSTFYRKASLHNPSPSLISRLRTYEVLHKRCGPHTKPYNAALNKLKSKHARESKGCKYIVWTGVNGLGNKMVSMASSFLYALLTNRALLVDLGTDVANIFCEPFPDTSWLLPRDFPFRNQFGSSKMRDAHSLRSLLKNNIMNTSDSPPAFVHLNPAPRVSDADELFYCDKSQDLLRSVPWLILLSDQYFAPSLFLNPSFERELRFLFPEKDTVFHHLGRYLFHPSNKVWPLITSFYQANLAKADEKIGLQIRVFNPKATPFRSVMDHILACALQRKLLPEVDSKKSVLPPSEDQISKAVLITSLYSGYYENISNMYWRKATVTGEVIKVCQPSHEEYQHRGDNKHNMKAWADIYLLSLSDVLVTSSWSTFGYVAQALGGLKPWIMGKPNHGKTTEPSCRRALSMEPCFHFPPSYECKTKAGVDAAALRPYLKHCVDRNTGVKLVSDRRSKKTG